MEELEAAVRDMKTNTAPGPDGLSTGFFKKFWGKIKGDIFEMLQALHRGQLDLARLNFGILVLLPKVKGANQIKHYRPICLLNVIYKIITKVLTLRLNLVINKVINEAQTAFIPGRFILDGVLVVHEILHELRMKKKMGIVLKLDFKKAYDKVNWKFLEDVLRRNFFDEKWIDWMLRAVQGGKVAVNLNGELGNYFRSFKGLRQGDPMPPLLFNLIADALSEILSTTKEKGLIIGLLPELVEGGLTHLQYADDTIMFVQNSEQNIINLKFLLFCYKKLSGMKINYSKSEIFTVGMTEADSQRVAQKFNCKLGCFPMKYLGLPIRRLSKAELSGAATKIEKRLQTWKCGHLSYGGKSILINSSLTSIPMYTMGFYWLYEGNHQRFDSSRGKFF
jgi:hypothetical protein